MKIKMIKPLFFVCTFVMRCLTCFTGHVINKLWWSCCIRWISGISFEFPNSDRLKFSWWTPLACELYLCALVEKSCYTELTVESVNSVINFITSTFTNLVFWLQITLCNFRHLTGVYCCCFLTRTYLFENLGKTRVRAKCFAPTAFI